MPDSITQEHCISGNHPCLEGHFPGDPIVPGVVLLDLVTNLLAQWKPGYRINSIAQAKFHLPLRPDQHFTIALSQLNDTNFKFDCLRENAILASGKLTIKAIK